MKRILQYMMIYCSLVIILFGTLVLSATIPKSAIENNIKGSVDFYRKHTGLYSIKKKKAYSYIHYFADVRKLNIIYCIDSDKPVESVLWAKYYKAIDRDTNIDFINLIKNSEEPNTQYLRYWNGSILFLRPMLTIFNMEQIYTINVILLVILALTVLVILFKKSKKLAIIFLIAIVLVSTWYATLYIEASVMLYIMLITSMIAIKIDNNKNKKSSQKVEHKLLILFFITGGVTAFFDFLTTEILGLFVPLLFIIIIRKEEGRLGSLKDIIVFAIKSGALWLTGYAGMWASKWILASVILHINAFEYVKDNINLRINGLQGLNNVNDLYSNVIPRNLFTIPLLDFINNNFFKIEVKIAILLVILFVLLFINWKELKNKKYLLVFVAIGLMPYVRYLILANHSFRHCMFTFRDQIITIICLLYIIIDCMNYKLMLKKVQLNKKRKEE